MPTYFTVVLLLWKLILLNTQYPVYHELKGLHQSASASFIVSPRRWSIQPGFFKQEVDE